MKTPEQNTDSRRTVLRRRAAAFAAAEVVEAAPGTLLPVVEFSLAGERYAVEAASVEETLLLAHCTPLPCTPAFVVGLISVRGRIRHVIDLREFFELPRAGIVDLHHVLLVRHGEVELGLLADLITGLRRVPRDQLQPSLPTLTGIRAEYLRGVTADGLAVLDVPSILTDRRQEVDDSVEN